IGAPGWDQATAHAHGPQSPPHPAGIPASPSLGIQHQGAAERIYAALCSAVIHDNATQILQRRGKCQRPGALLVELHRLSKVLLTVVHQAGCVRRDGFQGPDIGVELRTAPNSAGGVFGELMVLRGESDANQPYLISDVHREQGKYRRTLVLTEDAQTLASAE